MKVPRTLLIWSALVFCAATILAAMTWQTQRALASERDRIAAVARADLQERMRLALWRMDTLGAALIVEETNSKSLAQVRARFTWTDGNRQDLSEDLQALLDPADFRKIFNSLDHQTNSWKAPAPVVPEEAKTNERDSEVAQKSANNLELQKRSQAFDNISQQSAVTPAKQKELTLAIPNETPPRPVWIREQLFLLKAVPAPARAISGAWVDFPALRTRLLAESSDLLPAANLVPAEAPTDDGLVLASFPLRLEPGAIPVRDAGYSAPVTLSLVAGWIAAVIAIAAAALLVHGVMRLSERRASFVSAVTHELRTPLTTFRLYSEMLESGAVKPEKRGEYLSVLSREADRLSHLVENVLSFSGIERGSARSVVRETTVSELLESMRERLEARLSTAGMTLEMNSSCMLRVRVDSAAVEHILFNLIDNAAKYASSGKLPIVAIKVRDAGGNLEISVSDHGPGIPASERRRIFRAFHKSAREAAESRPGVGLGLALSRRLAKSLGGGLECVDSARGSCFMLRLPLGFQKA
ncbi:MAG: sensor histidine kinase [Luteolibacter sp.]